MEATVLLLEDNSILAMDLQDAAAKLGVSVSSTRDPAAALRMVDDLKPAAAFVDVNLSGAYEGLDVARAIREKTNVIIVTPYSIADLAGRMDGISDLPIYFKPLDTAVLFDVLRDVLGLQTA